MNLVDDWFGSDGRQSGPGTRHKTPDDGVGNLVPTPPAGRSSPHFIRRSSKRRHLERHINSRYVPYRNVDRMSTSSSWNDS